MQEIAIQTAKPRLWPRARHVVLDKLKLLLVATVIVAAVKAFVVDVVVVQGRSMEPTLHAGDYVLLDKVRPRLGLVERGQIVLVEGKTGEELLVKRVVAIGGDEVQMRYGRLLVNGKPGPAEEDTEPGVHTWGPALVPEGQVFVLGDNRPRSEDSEEFGPLPEANVKGRVMTGPWRWASAAHAGQVGH